MKLRQCFGPSNEFIKSLRQINKPDRMFVQRNNAQPNETQLLASCAYEDGTKWGKEASTIKLLKPYLFPKKEYAKLSQL